MPLAIVAAGLGAAGSIGGALISSSATNSAAQDAENAAAANNALEEQIYNSNKGLEDPYIQGGDAANTELQGFLGLGGDPAASQAAFQKYLNSTGYQFDLSSGSNAITGNKAASGLLDSGSTLKSLNAFGTGLGQQYGQQYVGNLQNLVTTGAGSANALAGEGLQYGSQVSSNNNNAATVAGNAAIANASSIDNLIGNAFKGAGYFGGSNGSSFGGGGSSGGGSDYNPFGGVGG